MSALSVSKGQTNCSVLFDLRSADRREHLVAANLLLRVDYKGQGLGANSRILRVFRRMENDGEDLVSRILISSHSPFGGFSMRTGRWYSLSVKAAVHAWLGGASNYGLRLDIISPFSALNVNCDDLGLQLAPGTASKPVLLVYTHDQPRSGAFRQPSSPVRLRRSLAQHNDPPPLHGASCQRKELFINYHQLGGSLLAPKVTDIGYCSGKCLHPISFLVRKTSHAKLQAIVHHVQRHGIPEPCCMPAAFRPLDFIYFDRRGTFVVRSVPDVVVDSCSCR